MHLAKRSRLVSTKCPTVVLVEPLAREENQTVYCEGNSIACIPMLVGFSFGLSSLLNVVPFLLGQDTHRSLVATLVWAPPYESGALSEFLNMSSGIKMPRLIYGSAFKGIRTKSLVLSALRAGFQGVDTAGGQPSQYRESGVGAALAGLFKAGVSRNSLFIQTKVHLEGDEECNSSLPIAKQVRLSLTKSLLNLGLAYVDSLLLQSPCFVHEQTMEAWRAMEDAVRDGMARQLGIANVASVAQLQKIHDEATVKPVVLQQQFSGQPATVFELLAWCATAGIAIQSLASLTANQDMIHSKTVQALAWKYHVTPPVLFFRFLMGLGIAPLIGTTSDKHMQENLLSLHVPLKIDDAEIMRKMLLIDCEGLKTAKELSNSEVGKSVKQKQIYSNLQSTSVADGTFFTLKRKKADIASFVSMIMAGGLDRETIVFHMTSVDFTPQEIKPVLSAVASALKAAGSSAMELKSQFYDAEDLKDAGYQLQDLKLAGYSITELKYAKFSAQELRNVGFSFKELARARFSAKELKDAEYTIKDLALEGYSCQDAKDAGFSAKELKSVGLVVQDVNNANFTFKELKNAGYSCRDLRHCGYSYSFLRKHGYSVKALKNAGFTAKEFKDAFSPEFKDDNSKEELPLTFLLESGYTLERLKSSHSLLALKFAGYTARELKDAGFAFEDLSSAGYSAADLKHAGCSLKNLKRLGYTIDEVEEAHFSAMELK